MADNLTITQGSGTTIAADDIGGVLHQRVKISQGADGSATDVSSAAPLSVKQPLAAASATTVSNVAPTGTAASAVAQNTARNSLLIVNNGTQTVYLGDTSGVTTSNGLPLPPGASWSTTTYYDVVYAITSSGTGDLRYWED